MWIISILKQSLMITAFVLVVMLIIEYINTQSRGSWSKSFQKSKFLQIVFAAFMGITPGCLGAYTVVSLYTHNVINFGALVAALVATSGDEAFIMISMIPETALWLTLALFIIAIITGLLTNVFFKNKNFNVSHDAHFKVHEKHIECKPYQPTRILAQLKNITFLRAVLMTVLVLFISNLVLKVVSGDEHNHAVAETQTEMHEEHNHAVHDKVEHKHTHEKTIHEEKETVLEGDTHQHPVWITLSFLLLSIFALFIISTVPEHFLEAHIWQHVIKIHFLRILLWTFGALLFVHYLETFIDVNMWIKDNMILILLAAVLIGFIPESGPHMVFVSLFMAGTIPVAILLASSISQDGHGSLPLLAESKKSFFIAKLINAVVAFVVGYLAILFA